MIAVRVVEAKGGECVPGQDCPVVVTGTVFGALDVDVDAGADVSVSFCANRLNFYDYEGGPEIGDVLVVGTPSLSTTPGKCGNDDLQGTTLVEPYIAYYGRGTGDDWGTYTLRDPWVLGGDAGDLTWDVVVHVYRTMIDTWGDAKCEEGKAWAWQDTCLGVLDDALSAEAPR